jgi:hypothetical protein
LRIVTSLSKRSQLRIEALAFAGARKSKEEIIMSDSVVIVAAKRTPIGGPRLRQQA